MRVIGPLGKDDDKFPILQDPFQMAKGVQGFDRIDPVERDSSQGRDELPDPRIDEEFLLGHIAYWPPGGQCHDGNIGPVLVFGEKNAGAFGRNVLPPLDADSVDGMKTGIANGPDKLIE
jgi:hypothetical protein